MKIDIIIQFPAQPANCVTPVTIREILSGFSERASSVFSRSEFVCPFCVCVCAIESFPSHFGGLWGVWKSRYIISDERRQIRNFDDDATAAGHKSFLVIWGKIYRRVHGRGGTSAYKGLSLFQMFLFYLFELLLQYVPDFNTRIAFLIIEKRCRKIQKAVYSNHIIFQNALDGKLPFSEKYLSTRFPKSVHAVHGWFLQKK